MKRPEGGISIRKFAALVGVSEKTVRNRIEDKTIAFGVAYDDKNNPYIIATVAAKEMKAELKYSAMQNKDSPDLLAKVAGEKRKTGRPKTAAAKKPRQAKPKPPPPNISTDFDEPQPPTPQPSGRQVLDIADEPGENGWLSVELDEFTTFGDAKRIEAIAMAELKRVEYLAKIKTLVPAYKINRAMYEAGQAVRDAITIIPDKCIDLIFTAKDRNTARNILANEINETLEKLANEITKIANV